MVLDQFDRFWSVLWVEAKLLVILVIVFYFWSIWFFFLYVDKFGQSRSKFQKAKKPPVWPKTWSKLIILVKTNQTCQEQSHWSKNNPFDHVDGFGPVDDFWSCLNGSWPVWSVSIGLMGSGQVCGHTGDCYSFLINLIFSLCR